MRNPDRLDNFYKELAYLHKTYFPDLRFAQLMHNFLDWHKLNFSTDGFYLEEDDSMERFMKFVDAAKGEK